MERGRLSRTYRSDHAGFFKDVPAEIDSGRTYLYNICVISFYDIHCQGRYQMEDIIARRQFDPLYIWLDIGFLLVLA